MKEAVAEAEAEAKAQEAKKAEEARARAEDAKMATILVMEARFMASVHTRLVEAVVDGMAAAKARAKAAPRDELGAHGEAAGGGTQGFISSDSPQSHPLSGESTVEPPEMPWKSTIEVGQVNGDTSEDHVRHGRAPAATEEDDAAVAMLESLQLLPGNALGRGDSAILPPPGAAAGDAAAAILAAAAVQTDSSVVFRASDFIPCEEPTQVRKLKHQCLARDP